MITLNLFLFSVFVLISTIEKINLRRRKKELPPRRLDAEIFDKHNDYATQNCKDENHGTSSPLTRDSGVVLRKISDCQLLLAVTLLFIYVSPRHFYTPVSARRWVPLVIKKFLMSYTVLVQSPNRVFLMTTCIYIVCNQASSKMTSWS